MIFELPTEKNARYSAGILSVLILILAAILSPALLGSARGENDDYIVTKVDGSVQKVCQLIGDTDFERNTTTTSLTYSRYGVAGTDLGVSFDYEGELMFLFGDTFGRNAYPFSGKDDCFAHTADSVALDGLNLTFYTGSQGKFLPPWVPQISQGAFEVPMEGVEVDNQTYVFFTTNHSEHHTMGSSVLAKFNDATLNFTYLYTFSNDKFINVHTAKVDNALLPGLPQSSGQGLLIWGSGEYRKSDPYLAFMPLESIEERATLSYYAGLTNNKKPVWSENESDALPLFQDPVIGELCISWNKYLNRWIMLYSGVSMRSSPLPWGDWSSKQVLFNPFADNGYGYFIHQPGRDKVTNVGRENVWGGAYGPYIVDKLTNGNNQSSTIYFALSTWNPYTTILMKAELTKSPVEVPETREPTNEVPELSSTAALVLTLILTAVIRVVYVRYSKRFNCLKEQKTSFIWYGIRI